MESEEMTPPNSPRLIDAREESRSPLQVDMMKFAEKEPLCSNCHGIVPSRNASFLHVGVMKCDNELIDASRSIILFNFCFPRTLAAYDFVEHLFFLARQQFQILEQSEVTPSADVLELDIRRNLRKFFEFLKKTMSESRNSSELQDFVLRVIDLTQQYILFVGSLPDHIASTLHTKNQVHHLFHAHIEIRWSIIELLHTASVLFPECMIQVKRIISYHYSVDVGQTDIVSEIIQLFMWDFVSLLTRQHNTELLISIIQLTELRKQKFATQSFWLLIVPVLHHLIQHDNKSNDLNCEISSAMFNLPPADLHCADPVGFCWWFLDNVSVLYQFDQHGVYCASNVPVPNCYFFLQTLTQASLSMSEPRLRCYLQCALRILSIWDSNASVIFILWDHFYKHLNDQIIAVDTSSTAASTSGTALHLLENCHTIASNALDCTKTESSFYLFLRLLTFFLKRSSVSGNGAEWRQMKGRLFSKFYSRKMQELNDAGLNNVTVLFIVLAHVADLPDTAGKLCELYSMIDIETTDYRRQEVVFRGRLALILLSIKKQVHSPSLIDGISFQFTNICKEFCSSSLTNDMYESLWKVIRIYLEALQDIVDASCNLGFHQHKLVGAGFHQLLLGCKDRELNFVLNVLQAIFMHLRFLSKRGQQGASSVKEFGDVLWVNVYGFVRRLSTTESPPLQLADIAVCFTLLAMDTPPCINEDFMGCLTYFCGNDQVNPRFLYLILSHQSLVYRLQTALTSYEKLILSSWVRCSWRLDSSSEQLCDVSRLVFRLPALVDIFDKAKLPEPDEFSKGSYMFIKAIGKGFDSLIQDLKVRSEYRALALEYFGDVAKHINWMLSNTKSITLTCNVYKLAGYLVKHCGSLIYVKSSPSCLLPFILDKLFPNRVLTSSNKDVPQSMLAAIQSSLHLFIQGIARLDYSDDAYIQRKLRDLVYTSVTKFQQIGSQLVFNESSVVHPVIRGMVNSLVPEVRREASHFRQHILGVVYGGFLSSDLPMDQSEIVKIMCFYQCLFNKTKDATEKARDCLTMLHPCLNILLQSDSQSLRDQLCQVMLQLLDASKKLPGDHDAVNKIKEMLMAFIRGKKSLNLMRLFKALEPISLGYPDLLVPSVPLMTQIVKDYEIRRGIGVDKQLRLCYFHILSALDEVGQVEKLKLIKEMSF